VRNIRKNKARMQQVPSDSLFIMHNWQYVWSSSSSSW